MKASILIPNFALSDFWFTVQPTCFEIPYQVQAWCECPELKSLFKIVEREIIRYFSIKLSSHWSCCFKIGTGSNYTLNNFLCWNWKRYHLMTGRGPAVAQSFCCCCCFSSESRIFHSLADVSITGERLQIIDLCAALMATEQWGFFSLPHLLWQGHPFLKVISEDPWHST